MHSSRDLPDQGIEFKSLMFPALAGGFFTTSTTWEVLVEVYQKPKNHLVSSCLKPFMWFLNGNMSLCLHVFFRTFILLLHRSFFVPHA